MNFKRGKYFCLCAFCSYLLLYLLASFKRWAYSSLIPSTTYSSRSS